MKGAAIKYSEAELSFIEGNKLLPIAEQFALYQAKFNRPDVNQANFNALRKRKRWLTGRTGCFEKGHTPSPLARPPGPSSTSFRKGHVPANKKPMYSERITKDGYIQIKVPERNPHTGAKTRYRLKHRWVWEQANGKVPDGLAIKFIDGDKTNCDLSNMKLVTREELAIVNKMGGNKIPAELQETASLIAQVHIKRHQRAQQ